jgi:dipeptidyl aminopeptidase/acylaminoacyl peptidase
LQFPYFKTGGCKYGNCGLCEIRKLQPVFFSEGDPMRKNLVVATLAAWLAGPALAATHPFGVMDMIDMQRISSPVPSPDGRWVAFVLRTYTLEANKGQADLWLLSIADGSLRRLTTHDAQDHSPEWSPDGRRLAFLSTRSGSSQVWTIPLDGGEAAQLTDHPLDVDAVKWSPDGARLALAMRVYPDCEDLACTVARDKEKGGVEARIYDSLFIRHWDQWADGKRSHLFVQDLDGGGLRDLMRGVDADCPTVPFGGAEEFAWSPGGDSLVYTAQNAEHPALSTNYDLFRVPVAGGALENLTAANPAWDTTPVFSPDGQHLAWLAMERPGYEADRFQVMLLDLAGGARRSLTSGWDRSAGSPAWAPDSRSLVVAASEDGRRSLFRVSLAGGPPRMLAKGGYYDGPGVLPDGRTVATRDSMTAAAEIWIVEEPGPRQVTRVNADRLVEAEMSEPEELWFTGARGDRVHGWFLKPVGFEPGGKYPFVMLVHGGPQGDWSDHFHYRWNPQAYAGRGYAVGMVDFHGSTGYGQAFTDSINQDWGGKPFEDLMLGLDHLLATRAWIDPERIGAAGASYGGYMVNWIAGHTDRFQVLVNHDGIFSTRSFYYNTEELWFPEWDLGGPAFENEEGYRRWDPSAFVQNWKTPMLVVQGAKDFRTVETEGISTFTALQRRGVESRLLYFPDENHWVLKPRNMKLWHETVLDWLDRFLK